MISQIATVALRILEFILALGFLAFLHELGHFLVARAFKIEVEEFGFGFPPRIVKLFTLGGTDFSLNWIPFGAFVRPKGENDPEIAGGLAAAKPLPRLAVLLGGPVVNLITGILLFSMVFMQVGAPDMSIVQIAGVSPNSPAEQVGIQSGDIVQVVNGTTIDSSERFTQLIKGSVGKEVSLTLKRGDEVISLNVTPRVKPPEGEGALGVMMTNPTRPMSWFQSLGISTQMAYSQAEALFLLPARLIQGSIAPEQARIMGPKGMYDIYQQARALDVQAESQPASSPQKAPAVNTLWLMAIISVALGITNLLPLPALDGGRILFILPELILRKRVPAKFENMVHMIGFLLLLGLMVVITVQDFIHPIVLP